MPIIDKRDPNNWYNSIRVNNAPAYNKYKHYLDHPETFDVNRLDVNEFDMGNGKIVAKIPKIPGRITRHRKNENSSEYYIQLIIEKGYDKEKKQGRNIKVNIGIDVSWHLPGMMRINEKYHEYFDKNGVLYNDPMARTEQKKRERTKQSQRSEEPDIPAGTEPGNTANDITGRKSKPSEPSVSDALQPDAPQIPEPEEPTEEQMLEELKKKQAILDQKIAEQERLNEDLQKINEEYQKAKDELDSMRMIRIAQWDTAKENRIRFLSDILDGQRDIVVRQAGKNPYVPMSQIQIHMINEVLSEMKQIFSGIEGEEYLKLAEEPRPDPDNEKNEIPGSSYGEMAFILQAYFSIFHAFTMKRLRYRDEDGH